MRSSGLAGGMRVALFAESSRILDSLENIFAGRDKESAYPYKIKNVRERGKGFFIELAGIDTIDAADALKGQFLFISREALTDPEEDEYYWHDIIGLAVITEEGEKLGTITSIFPTGSNDVYVCQGEKGEILLPAIDSVIKKIDIPEGAVIIELLEGLLEMK